MRRSHASIVSSQLSPPRNQHPNAYVTASSRLGGSLLGIATGWGNGALIRRKPFGSSRLDLLPSIGDQSCRKSRVAMADSRRPMSPVIKIFSERLLSGDLPPTLARKEAECAGWGRRVAELALVRWVELCSECEQYRRASSRSCATSMRQRVPLYWRRNDQRLIRGQECLL